MRRGIPRLLLIGLLGTAPLRAETAEQTASVVERSAQLFRKGTAAFEAEKYSDAYASLRAAWDLAPDYRTAAGLGQVELRLAQYRDAAEHLAYCLRHFPPSTDEGARAHVEEGLDEAREHVAALRVRVDPEGAAVTIDGAPAGHAPLDGLVFVTPGKHVVEATAEGRRAASETVDAPVRVTRDVLLSLGAPASTSPTPSAAEPPPGAASATPAAEPLAGVSAGGLSNTAWTVIVGGSLTAVAVGTAVLFDVKGASAGSDADDLRRSIGTSGGDCAAPSPALSSQCAALRDATDTRNSDNRVALVAAIGAGVLGAATIGTAIYFESRRETRPSPSAALSVRAWALPGMASVVVAGAL